MADTYIKLEDMLKKKQFSYDLKQYAVTEQNIRKAAKIEVVPDEDVGELENVVKALFNRCAALTRGRMCFFCDIKNLCDKNRTIMKTKQEEK